MNSDKYILIVNGPNINLTGIRRTDIYGSGSYSDMTAWIEANAPCRIVVEQYNGEGQIIDALHRAHFDNECAGVVLNAGAYTHYSYAIADAVEAITKPVVEVHISNILSREDFRCKSVIAKHCIGSIAGFGWQSYTLALKALTEHLTN